MLAPVLQQAAAAGLRHDVWLAADVDDNVDALATELGISATFSSARVRVGRTGFSGAIGCHEHVSSIRTWTRRPPLVVVYGESGSTFLATLGARFGGGWIVHLESGVSSRALFDPFPAEMLRRMTFRLTNFALVAGPEEEDRMRSHHCKIANIGAPLTTTDEAARANARSAVLDALLSWSR